MNSLKLKLQKKSRLVGSFAEQPVVGGSYPGATAIYYGMRYGMRATRSEQYSDMLAWWLSLRLGWLK